MLTTEDLVKLSMVGVATSFVAPVVLGLIDRWRWQPPRFWTRLRLFLEFWKKFPW